MDSLSQGVNAGFITSALARRYKNHRRARRKSCPTYIRKCGLDYFIAAATVLCDWVKKYMLYWVMHYRALQALLAIRRRRGTRRTESAEQNTLGC
jgi:hypothetical protein